MKLGKHLGALINTRGALGAKPGGVEKTLKSGAPRTAACNTKREQADQRMVEGTANLAKIWR